MRRARLWHLGLIFLLAAAVLPVALPFADSGFPQGHDTPAHLANLFRFDRALWRGQLPVRWVEGLTAGHGQPLFNFYQVGFYYLVEIPRLAGLPLSSSVKAAPVALWWLATAFAFLWLRPFGVPAAVAGAVTLALSPYAIIDVFVRAAYPEFTAIVVVVAALWTSDRFLRSGSRRYWLGFAVAVAGMLLSHLPATLIAAPALAAGITMGAGTLQSTSRRVVLLAAAALLGLGLASFYVGPALLELDLVQIRTLTTNGVDFHRHFVPARLWFRAFSTSEWNYFGTSVTDESSLLPVQISWVQWLAVVAALAMAGYYVLRRRSLGRVPPLLAWTAVIALAMFMMHSASAPVWEAMPALSFIQFPWRFFLLISIGGAALTALMVARIPGAQLQAVVAVVIVLFHIYMYDSRLRPEHMWPYEATNIDDPRWTEALSPESRDFEEPSYDPVGASRTSVPRARVTVVEGRADVSASQPEDVFLLASVVSDGPSLLQLSIRCFPGWTVEVDGQPVEPSRSEEGYMIVPVSTGAHWIHVRFGDTAVRRASNIVTLCSAAGLLAIAMFGWWSSRSRARI